MTTDELQVLREFRAGIPAPDEMTRRTVYAYATSAGSSRSQPRARLLGTRRWRSWRGGLLVAVALLALAGTAVAIAGHSLFGFSNHGTRIHAGPSVREILNGKIFTRAGIPFNTQNPDTFTRLALRHGIGIYTARTRKGNHLCYYVGTSLSQLNGLGCDPYVGRGLPERLANVYGRKGEEEQKAWLKNHPFPSPARPILDLSFGRVRGAFVYLQPIGLGANGVRSIQLLAQSDCHPVVTVPVINNVYIDANLPKVAAAFLVARNASGKIIWHSAPLSRNPYVRTPLDHKLPPNCGFR